MTNEEAVIIAAVITGLIAAGTFLGSVIYTNKTRKNDSKEKFFYEVFSKRLALYEDIAIWADSLSRECAGNIHAKDAIMGNLLAFENRCVLYGTNELKEILFRLRNDFSNAFIALDIARKSKELKTFNTDMQVYIFLHTFIKDDMEKLQNYMSGLPYGAYIDELQIEIIGELMKKQKS